MSEFLLKHMNTTCVSGTHRSQKVLGLLELE